MIEIEGKFITYSVKIDNEAFWHKLTGGDQQYIKRTGDSWYHYEISRHRLERVQLKHFSETDQAALLALETDYYHFHWYDPKPDARRAKTFEKRLKKSKEKYG